MVAEATFSTKYDLRTSIVRHGKIGPEQTLDTLSDIKMTIYADSGSLKPKELVISSSKHGTYKSTKPSSTTLIPLNRYSFLNQILSLRSKTAITTTIRGVSFR